MSYGISVLNSAGQTINTTDFAVVTYDSFLANTATAGSKSYPELVGYTIYAFATRFNVNNASSCSGYVSVSYPGGIPTVSYGLLVNYGVHTDFRVYVMVT